MKDFTNIDQIQKELLQHQEKIAHRIEYLLESFTEQHYHQLLFSTNQFCKLKPTPGGLEITNSTPNLFL